MPRSEILTFEEIERVALVAHGLGVDSVRLTGGEPLVRASVTELVVRLGRIGFSDLSMTTNGSGLARMAPELAAAGLMRVNISCDSLKPERFAGIRRRGVLATVLEAMDAAEQAGLAPVKINVVVMAGVNDDEIVDLAGFARNTGRVVRFIEFMPLDGGEAWERSKVVPGEEILARIGAGLAPRARKRTGRRLGAGGSLPFRGRLRRDRCHHERDQSVLWFVQPPPPHCRRGHPQLPVRQRGAPGTGHSAVGR